MPRGVRSEWILPLSPAGPGLFQPLAGALKSPWKLPSLWGGPLKITVEASFHRGAPLKITVEASFPRGLPSGQAVFSHEFLNCFYLALLPGSPHVRADSNSLTLLCVAFLCESFQMCSVDTPTPPFSNRSSAGEETG